MCAARIVPLLLSLVTGLSVVAAGQNLPAPQVSPARRFQFTPPAGTAWTVQGTVDGRTWTDLAGPFFAVGKMEDQLQPAGAERNYRLLYIDPASVGFAPVSVGGQTLIAEHQGKARHIVFMDATFGILRLGDTHARSFTATWTKTAPNKAEAILTGADGSFTILKVEFIAAGLGHWGMEDIPSIEAAALVKVPIDCGSFALISGLASRSGSGTVVPSDLSGRRLVLNESGVISLLEFTGADRVSVKKIGGAVLPGTYDYDPEDRIRGHLALNLPGSAREEFRLEMQTPSTGKMVSTTATAGRSPLRSGTFTLPNRPEPLLNALCPPTGIAGLTYVFADSAPCTMTFYANGEGVQRKEVSGITRVTHFRYLYSRTGGEGADIAVTFPGANGDLVDNYELDFDNDCSGDYRRTSYAGGNSVDQRNSTFRPAPPNGLNR